MGSDQLPPKHTWTERENAEDEYRDVLSSLSSGSQLRSRGQRRKFVDTCTNAREDHASDEDIHGVSSRAYDHAYYDEGSTNDGDVSATKYVAERADEWTDRGQRKKIGEYKPDPSICTSNVCIDVWGDLLISTM